ncbi:Flagellin and related hook-associated proteins [butyrate-producing bacterium SS3/4]|nr:Flagellin and related hook-associated proteins [butyrate-producing bacterium SS3/4]
MVIQHNIAAINSYRNLGTNQSALSKNLEKLSSGYKINRAGDDAAGLAISETMRSQINGLNQAVNNANDAIGLIQTAEGAMTETHSMLQRMKTLSTQAANGTYTKTARDNIKAEIDALNKEITRIATTTEFNGEKPLSPDTKTKGKNLTFFIGASADASNAMTVAQMTMTAVALTIDRIAVDNTTNAFKAMKSIDAAIEKVSTYRATLGAAQNRLEHTVNNLKVTSENITSAESRIRDTDMADEITAYTKNNILLQAAQSMLSQSNAMPQGVLSMLQ